MKEDKTASGSLDLVIHHHEHAAPLWHHVLSGTAAGAVSFLIPFYTEKIKNIRKQGVKGRGFAVEMLGEMASNAVHYGLYERLLSTKRMSKVNKEFNKGPIAGAVAACAQEVTMSPFNEVDGLIGGGIYQNSFDAFRQLLNKKNLGKIGELFKIHPIAMIFGNVPHAVVTEYVTPKIMDVLKVDDACSSTHGRQFLGLPFGGLTRIYLAHGIAGAISASAMTPIENIREHVSEKVKGVFSTKGIVDTHAFPGLFAGCVGNMRRGAADNAINAGVFDMVGLLLLRKRR